MNDNNGKRPTFAIYPLAAPGGDAPTDWPKALIGVLAAHRERSGGDPVSVVVNKSVVGRVAEALRGMGLGKLAVTSSGGCLSWECWLETSENGRKPMVQAKDRSASLPGSERCAI